MRRNGNRNFKTQYFTTTININVTFISAQRDYSSGCIQNTAYVTRRIKRMNKYKNYSNTTGSV